MEETEPELVDNVKKLMFVFEDIIMIDERGIQGILKEVDNKELALALKTASEELKEKIFTNMSKRAAEANLDIPWEEDHLRDMPNERERMFNIFESTLKKLNFPYIILEGGEDVRMQNAIDIVKNHFYNTI